MNGPKPTSGSFAKDMVPTGASPTAKDWLNFGNPTVDRREAMIVVRVELWSAITGDKTELARMHISNDGTHPNPRMGNYNGQTFRGRDTETLSKLTVSKSARLENFPRLQLHVWNMVARMLLAMGYK